MNASSLSNTLPVRMDPAVIAKLKRIAQATGLNRSAVMRLAINHGLPLVEAGRIALKPIPPTQ